MINIYKISGFWFFSSHFFYLSFDTDRNFLTTHTVFYVVSQWQNVAWTKKLKVCFFLKNLNFESLKMKDIEIRDICRDPTYVCQELKNVNEEQEDI